MEKKYAIVLALLITALIAINISFLKTQYSPPKETVKILRIIDGDTLQLEDNRKIRLININTPEKSQPRHELAINFLKQYENKSVEIEITGTDKYDRTLARIFTPDYLNLELIKRGFAAKFLVDESEIPIFAQAEKQAIDSSLGIWKKSSYYNCIESVIDKIKEKIILKNNCNKLNIEGWTLKDESTKLYKFPSVELETITIHTTNGKDNATDLFWSSQIHIWNDDRDTLYLYDKNWQIVHYNVYGY